MNKCEVTKSLIDAAKKAQGIGSDYRMAKVLKVTENTLGNWRAGRSKPADDLAVTLAQMAGVDPGSVLAELAAERAKDDASREVWRSIAQRLKGGAIAAGVAMFCGGWTGGPDGGAIAAPLPAEQGGLYIMSNRILRAIRRRLAKINPANLTGFSLASA